MSSQVASKIYMTYIPDTFVYAAGRKRPPMTLKMYSGKLEMATMIPTL